MKLSDVRADAANRLRLAALSAPPLSPALQQSLATDKAFAYGFDGYTANEPFICYRSEPLSWSWRKRGVADQGRTIKRAIMADRPKFIVVWGRTRYCLAYEQRTIDRFADAIEKMPARYFETPFEILEPHDS